MLIGAGAAGFGQGVFMKLMAFPAFVAGVVVSSVLVKRVELATPNRAARVLYGKFDSGEVAADDRSRRVFVTASFG